MQNFDNYVSEFLIVKINVKLIKPQNQCCGAGAGGAEIILGPGAGAENKF